MAPYEKASEAAFAILMAFRHGNIVLTRKAASFVGETLVDATPLSEKQMAWMQTLLGKANLPKLREASDDA